MHKLKYDINIKHTYSTYISRNLLEILLLCFAQGKQSVPLFSSVVVHLAPSSEPSGSQESTTWHSILHWVAAVAFVFQGRMDQFFLSATWHILFLVRDNRDRAPCQGSIIWSVTCPSTNFFSFSNDREPGHDCSCIACHFPIFSLHK